jgi:hypothetical protein
MSLMATQVLCLLEELFPANPHKRIFEEHYVNYKNTKLFFDFYIKELQCFIECQGEQHIKFVKHFHGTAKNFRRHKKRDNLKIEYVEKNNMCLVRLYYSEEITKELIMYKIKKAMEEGFYE